MEDKLQKLSLHVRMVSLSEDERAVCKQRISAYMTMVPNRAAAGKNAEAGPRSLWTRAFFGRTAGISAASFLVLFSVAGVSYAAEGALPGEKLYTVKIGFNEAVHSAFVMSEESRAAWDFERASRRLAEAEEMAHLGTLGMEAEVTLEKQFRAHAEGASMHLRKAQEASSTDNGDAADLMAHAEGTLLAHQQIIDALAAVPDVNAEGENTQAPTRQKQVAVLVASVQREVAEFEQKRVATRELVSSKTEDAAKTFARGRRTAALARIAEARSWLSKHDEGFSSDSIALANQRLSAASAQVSSGDALMEAKDYQKAFGNYVAAQRLAQEAKLLVNATNTYDVTVSFRAEAPAKPDVEDKPEVKAKKPSGGTEEKVITDDTLVVTPAPPVIAAPSVTIPLPTTNLPNIPVPQLHF